MSFCLKFICLTLLLSGSVLAMPFCQLYFDKQGSETLPGAKLKEIPELGKYLREMLGDNLLPSNMRRIIVRALESPDVTIHNLTDQVRKESGMFYPAAHVVANRKFRTHNNGHSDANSDAALELKSHFFGQDPKTFDNIFPDRPRREWIMVSDQKMAKTDEQNALAELVHEFSHVRFDSFVQENISKMARTMPEFVRLDSDGHYSIDSSLYTFLAERYALHVEFQTLKATYGKLHDNWPANFGGPHLKEQFLALSPESLRKIFSNHVIDSYEITDPRVLRLRDLSVFQILRGEVYRP